MRARSGRSLGMALLAAVCAQSQTAIDNADYVQWLQERVHSHLFDIRGDNPVDSIIRPCFYTTDAPRWVDSLGCTARLLIVCHGGILAHQVAQQIVANGYPEDSVYSSGFDLLTATRAPASDTIPLSLLSSARGLPPVLSAHQLDAVLGSEREYLLIDVRGAQEAASGMIPGACLIPWPDPFQAKSDELPRDRDIILYCRTGNRAGQARDYLIAEGFTGSRIVNFGGYTTWEDAGLAGTAAEAADCRCAKKAVARATPRAVSRVRPAESEHLYDPRGRRVPVAVAGIEKAGRASIRTGIAVFVSREGARIVSPRW